MKIRTRDKKKKTLLPVKLETFPSHLHHTHERDGMAHVYTPRAVCQLCQSCQCLVCLTQLSKFPVRTTKRVRSNVVKDHFD